MLLWQRPGQEGELEEYGAGRGSRSLRKKWRRPEWDRVMATESKDLTRVAL